MTRVALLTGITGFIGGALAERLLAAGWQVHAVVRPSSDLSSLSVRDQCTFHVHDGSTAGLIEILRQVRPEVVFHLASLFLVDHRPDQVDDLIASNLLFPTQLLEAMVAAGATRLVNAGTNWQHHGTAAYRPVNLYAATKQAFEDLLAFYHDAKGVSAISLKLYDTFGLQDRRRKLIAIVLEAVRSGEALEMSPGEQIIDLTHVDDVADAFLQAADLLTAQETPLLTSYFVSGERLSLKQLVRLIEETAGTTLRVTFGGRPYRPREVMVPLPAEGHALPGWAPQHTLKAGLLELLG